MFQLVFGVQRLQQEVMIVEVDNYDLHNDCRALIRPVVCLFILADLPVGASMRTDLTATSAIFKWKNWTCKTCLACYNVKQEGEYHVYEWGVGPMWHIGIPISCKASATLKVVFAVWFRKRICIEPWSQWCICCMHLVKPILEDRVSQAALVCWHLKLSM